MNKIKRTYIPLYPPWFYELEPKQCPYCKSTDIVWSEYRHYIACNSCKKDIKPTFDGFLDGGPVPVNAAAMFGVRFDILNLETNKIEYCDLLPLPYTKEWQKIKHSLTNSIKSKLIDSRFKLIDKIYNTANTHNLIDKENIAYMERKKYIKGLFDGKKRNS